jgi:homoserine kinase
MATESFVIKTPCSSANIGPGFDVIGLALSMYLELHVTIDKSKGKSEHPLNCRVTYEGQGEESGDISLDPEVNLITRVALYVLRCHDQRSFPVETHVHIKNPIPLGRGLGSSGAAVVAGVLLGKEVGHLDHLTPERLFDFCLMIGEFHVCPPSASPVMSDIRERAPPGQCGSCLVRRLRRHISEATHARGCGSQGDPPQRGAPGPGWRY